MKTTFIILTGAFHLLFAGAVASAGNLVIWGNAGDVPAGLNDVKAAAAGEQHIAALRKNGTVVAWGHGPGTNVPAGLSNVKAIAAGTWYTVALRKNGTVAAWGIGSGSKVPAELSNVKAIAAGLDHTVALKEDGTVVAWGANQDGQTNVPAGLNEVKAIAAGAYHTVALRENGTVVAWGHNLYGQTNVDPSRNNVKAIAAGKEHTVTLAENGAVSIWGNYIVGVGGATGVKAIAAKWDHILALKEDGTVVAWGANQYGQADVPAGLSGVRAIAAGNLFSMAILEAQPPTPDTVRPSIRITGPKTSGKYPKSRTIKIKGSARDNAGLARWQYKLNKGKWKKGGKLSGTSRSWNKRIGKVKSGENTVQVRVYDRTGNVSLTAKRNINLRK